MLSANKQELFEIAEVLNNCKVSMRLLDTIKLMNS